MPREKSIACREDKITTSSSSSDVDDHKSLDADQDYAHKAKPSTHDTRLLSVMSQHRGGVPLQQDPCTRKYEARWKNDLSM